MQHHCNHHTQNNIYAQNVDFKQFEYTVCNFLLEMYNVEHSI